MTPEQAVVATARMRRQSALLRSATSSAMQRLWDALKSFDDAGIEEFSARATPVLQGAGKASSNLAAGYLSLVSEQPIAAPALDLITDFRHPFIGVWRDLSRGGQISARQAPGGDDPDRERRRVRTLSLVR